MPVERALARFRGQLVGHVWDAAALEGNPYTLPEVQTLLEGVTVGGHRLEDEKQVLALVESTQLVHDMVADGTFTVSKETSDALHAIVAPHEAIEAGHVRGEGQVRGGGTVNLGEAGTFIASGCDDGGEALREEYAQGSEYLGSRISHPVERAVAYFCWGVRRQFYFDGSKRTSRLMMNGQLLQSRLDAISIPFNRRLEFNQHLIVLYSEADATPETPSKMTRYGFCGESNSPAVSDSSWPPKPLTCAGPSPAATPNCPRNGSGVNSPNWPRSR